MLVLLTVLTESYFVMKLQFLFEKNLPVKRYKKNFVLSQSSVTVSMFSGFNKMKYKGIKNKNET